MTRPVAVVGTGTIGASWAALFLARGHDVRAHDPAPGAEARLRNAVADAWPALARLGLAPGADRSRLSFHGHLDAALHDAGFVQESGPEDLDLKAALLGAIDANAPADAVVASSSSGLMPSTLQAMCARHPERVLVGHPFHPAALVPLVEVVPGAASTERVVTRAIAFYADLGKRPIVVRREVPGHVTNRLQAALWREAYSLVERGVATVADIDTAISNGPGLRWALLGPLVGQHLSGGPGGMAHTLRHLGPPAQAWMDDLGTPQLTDELADLLVRGVDDELAGIDQQAMAAARDELLVDLLARKRDATALP
ncbi:3-hydroxyacyl-CoA dehydrogenase NAD-binding domain-containing protein [Nocardioides kongjuensis]|uniref:3-hydroxyacyl-CoA dehydrogenase n=1 Tax=Nocardioides kongjuensis TaxID=349522 RepID=A0A852RQK5_9ACTN|nr:3-hydroxyacyl-CoA dehydrogenase NAD-binding domain-containing protein [Nocardioides kongjuensis]NYD33235.1 3-hydroxyacyl-CoA dehydrogenase [Nocardioides kongjuensis]